MDPGLIDRLYESAFAPDLWPGVLGEMADLASARAGFLFLSKGEIHHWTSSTQVGMETMKPLVESGWVARSERFLRFTATRHSGFRSDTAIYTSDEMKTDPFYRDVLYPRGLGWAAGSVLHLPTGDVLAISLEREHVRGPVEPSQIEQLDILRPHLARSALMSARLHMERARTVSETLAAIGLAGAVLDDNGRVLAANPRLEALTGYLHWRAGDRIALTDRNADGLLWEALAAIHLDTDRDVRSFPIRDDAGESMMVAHLIPVRLSARDVFAFSAAVLVLTPVTLPGAAPVELVQSLFDLTPAEARVARGLADGKTVEDLATDGGVSANTIRTQVRGVLEKTGCGRQADVVALLTAISSSRPRSAV